MRTTLIASLLVAPMVFLVSTPVLASGFHKIAACNNSDSCSVGASASSIPVTESTCSASITGCHGTGGCAYCSCNTTTGCGCNCSGGAGSSMAALSFDRPYYGVFHDLTLAGLVGLLQKSDPSWTVVTTVDSTKEAASIRVTGNFEGPRQVMTLRDTLDWLARQYGVRLEANERTRTVAFLNADPH